MLISGFIFIYLSAVSIFAFPFSFKPWSSLRNMVTPMLNTVGLWQNWSMFSPYPRSYQCYVDAEIEYLDGHKEVWSFPRMEQLSFWQRFKQERYRKLVSDNLCQDIHNALMPHIAKYVAYESSIPNNPPMRVRFNKHTQFPWMPWQINQPNVSAETEWKSVCVATYTIMPEDLP
jgi:hypothetical protein